MSEICKEATLGRADTEASGMAWRAMPGPSAEAKLALPADPQELLVRAAADAGFSDAQWKSMFYEKGPYDVTFPSYTTKKFVALLLERLQAGAMPGVISIGSAPQTHDVSSYDGEHGLSPRPGHGPASGQRTTRADTDATDLTGWTSGGIRLDRHPLISEAYRVCVKAEAVPASDAATAASSAAWELLRFIDKFLDEQQPVEPPAAFPKRPSECTHESATVKCNDCGIDFRNARVITAVFKVCDAYESGIGHGLQKDGSLNPYSQESNEHEAWDIGYALGVQRAGTTKAATPEPPSALLSDLDEVLAEYESLLDRPNKTDDERVAWCRVVHGLSYELVRDELRALGNSIVPQIAYIIGRAIVKASQETSEPRT